MSEVTVDEKAIKITCAKTVKYICDECNIGEMKPTGIMVPMIPPLYGHMCTFCTHQRNLKHIYPRTVLITEGEIK